MRKLCLLLLAVVVLFTGCAKAAPKEESCFYTFIDSVGQTVVLPEQPKRVAVLFSSYAQIWTLAGGEICVTVGESVERGFADASVTLADDGAGKSIDTELLLQEEVDFVIASADISAQVDACQILRSAGISCALFRVDTFEEYLLMLEICTDITGNTDAFDTYGLQVNHEIDGILETVKTYNGERKDILFIRAGSQYSATKAKRAPDNFVCIMLDELGVHNIADDAEILLDGLSLEEILVQDPDYIFISTMGDEQAATSYMMDLFSQEGWRDLSAVQNEDYIFLPKDLFHFKPNHQWADAYRMLAQILYPELQFDE